MSTHHKSGENQIPFCAVHRKISINLEICENAAGDIGGPAGHDEPDAWGGHPSMDQRSQPRVLDVVFSEPRRNSLCNAQAEGKPRWYRDRFGHRWWDGLITGRCIIYTCFKASFVSLDMVIRAAVAGVDLVF